MSAAIRWIQALLCPRSIAVIGATERPGYGSRLLQNLIHTGYTGRIHPVNPRRETVFDLPCYPHIAALPGPVDLAAIVVPAAVVPEVLRDCAAAHAGAALIVSAGFAEAGPQGATLEREIAAIAQDTGLRVCGPNCLGIASLDPPVWATANILVPVDAHLRPGGLAIVSQSGATAFGPVLAAARDRAIGVRAVISSGNEADLTAADYIRALAADPEVAAIALVLEAIRDGPRFRLAAEVALSRGVPLIVLKLGRSTAGARAARTHTAALTGSDAAADAFLRQCGAVRVHDYDELVEVAAAMGAAPRPRGRRVAVVSHSGGIGGLVADHCAAVGLLVPPLAAETQSYLERVLAGRGAAANPADITGHFERESFADILAALVRDGATDAVAVATAGSRRQASYLAEAAATARVAGKPLLVVWTGPADDGVALPALRASVPVLTQPTHAARALAGLVLAGQRARYLGRQAGSPSAPPLPAAAVAAWRRALRCAEPASPVTSLDLLAQAGVPVPRGSVCRSAAEAEEAAAALGYPVVLKVISPDLPHKTEAGAVSLGLSDAAAVRETYTSLRIAVERHAPKVRIEGVLVQAQVGADGHGIEVLVGLARDPQLGMVLTLGLGGVQAEALGAVAHRVCPLGPGDAEELIAEVPGLAVLLRGWRGQPAADRAALEAALERLADLGAALTAEVESLDINPLIVLPAGRGIRAVDCLIIPAR